MRDLLACNSGLPEQHGRCLGNTEHLKKKTTTTLSNPQRRWQPQNQFFSFRYQRLVAQSKHFAYASQRIETNFELEKHKPTRHASISCERDVNIQNVRKKQKPFASYGTQKKKPIERRNGIDDFVESQRFGNNRWTKNEIVAILSDEASWEKSDFFRCFIFFCLFAVSVYLRTAR